MKFPLVLTSFVLVGEFASIDRADGQEGPPPVEAKVVEKMPNRIQLMQFMKGLYFLDNAGQPILNGNVPAPFFIPGPLRLSPRALESSTRGFSLGYGGALILDGKLAGVK